VSIGRTAAVLLAAMLFQPRRGRQNTNRAIALMQAADGGAGRRTARSIKVASIAL
jgi:hypothetical protein